jgi:hypothetical protein
MDSIMMPNDSLMMSRSGGGASSWAYIGTSLPPGVDSSKLVALYQFDDTANYLDDRSGNGRDLVIQVGGVAPLLQVSQNLVGRQYYDDVNGHFTTTAIEAALAPLAIGAFTIELLFSTPYTGDNDVYAGIGGIGADVEANNFLFVIYARLTSGFSNKIRIVHESGAGTEVDTDTQVSVPPELHHFVVTKNEDGVTHKLYINGICLETVVATGPATGGTNSRILVGGGNPSAPAAEPDMTIMSARFISAEFTAAQVLSAYQGVRV